ncbi:GNAT family N-acetyltransferase [Aliikangiella marina]|uniref:GNAT family N-acetyltransferase n=1 Tax=Aliikangiella marina TaxID=1712262 RepID=A0A545TDA2_9GAMM|nr:GNAT family N-acetyltransferase [Aliikangiella marina]TQV75198.1 GNAT family N-acetyltransferase [Aliikangiella marina]
MQLQCISIDYEDEQHAKDLVNLLDDYAKDPMGGGQALAQDVKSKLPHALANRGNAISVIAYADGHPAGLANCFEEFSTFQCKPIMNIHDLVVSVDYRGKGIAKKLLQKVEQIASNRGCCKLTLEVLDGNLVAKNAYFSFGFEGYQLDPQFGHAIFLEKPLN